VGTKLLRIAERARKDRGLKFNNLYHLMKEELPGECFQRLKGNRAVGVDEVTKEEYGANLEANLKELTERLQRMSYRPEAARRVYIPKPGGGKLRPLGIPCLEDKLEGMALGRILEAIYEEEFVENSYGFRPGRGCHDALRALSQAVENGKTNYIVEADVKKFFDSVEHDWMIRMLEERIGDRRVLRLVKRFLKAGIMEEGQRKESEEGTPQGSSLSPMLANVYLHYALDLWFERVYRKSCKGKAVLIRYADDYVACFQSRDDAMGYRAAMEERLKKFGLEVEPTKTKVLEFGPWAEKNARSKGEKPETFEFLGFTHYCSKGRDGKRYRMKRVTSGKKNRAKLVAYKEWIKRERDQPLQRIMEKVAAKLRGHYGYYGVSDNSRGIERFYRGVEKLLYKWLNRRSQRKSYKWEEFLAMLERFKLPEPRIQVNLWVPAAKFKLKSRVR
jgi:RNA-directed DNA polymerase